MKSKTPHEPSVHILNDIDSISRATLDIFRNDAMSVIQQKGIFTAAISGGSTPKHFFELLGRDEKSLDLPWQKIHIFWVDERYVPHDSEDSNYKLAEDAFLNKVSIPEENIHSIPTHYSDLQKSINEYENQIREVFKIGDDQKPSFDLVILGMGVDGHTASLFPGNYAAIDSCDIACSVYIMNEKLDRITLTHSAITEARHILVLVSGGEKADILQDVFSSEVDEVRWPIHSLWGVLEKVDWLVDEPAAVKLKGY